tara:strand:+ start:65779 stop:67053 length:1275 start_codon:yes stop_codon:yes gene_type:complete
MNSSVIHPNVYKALYILLATGLASRCIEKGVEAGFIGIAVLLSIYIAIKEFTGTRHTALTEKVKTSTHTPLMIVLPIMLTSWGISSYFGINPDYSLKKWGEVLALVLGGAILYIGIRRSPLSALEKFPRYVMWAGASFSLLLILESLHLIPWVSENIRNLSKGPLHTQIRSFSTVAAILIPFAWVEALKKDRLKYWILPSIIFIASIVAGGRSGWLALGVSAAIFAFIYPWKTVARPLVNKIIFGAQFVLGSIVGGLLYRIVVGNEFFEYRLGIASGDGASGGSGRIEIWKFALDKFTEAPWMGIGVKGFRHLDFTGYEVTSTMHPHNAILELMVETGIIGTILAITFACLLMYRLGKSIYNNKSYTHPRIHNLAIACVCSLIAFLTASLTLTSIFHAWWLTYFVVLYIIIDSAHIAIHRKVIT